MSDVTARRIDDIAPYGGPNAIQGIRFRPVGRALGVSAWGMNGIVIDAGCTGYPEHDHIADGQEEVYVVLEGGGTLEAGGENTDLGRGSVVRVGPSTKRKILPGPQGISLLVVGGTPGRAYPRK